MGPGVDGCKLIYVLVRLQLKHECYLAEIGVPRCIACHELSGR